MSTENQVPLNVHSSAWLIKESPPPLLSPFCPRLFDSWSQNGDIAKPFTYPPGICGRPTHRVLLSSSGFAVKPFQEMLLVWPFKHYGVSLPRFAGAAAEDNATSGLTSLDAPRRRADGCPPFPLSSHPEPPTPVVNEPSPSPSSTPTPTQTRNQNRARTETESPDSHPKFLIAIVPTELAHARMGGYARARSSFKIKYPSIFPIHTEHLCSFILDQLSCRHDLFLTTTACSSTSLDENSSSLW
ncbi:hypothetical protein BD410DRAFT_836462 [Rickenella mellea]|uniref:Uncharacterized protein n=1 Tax=Rickenella mellea TaxID=50990 RepID=A0A4Y7QG36_9AGAM|nr:hypothetical protein BD410DRAFT_836462 [Rickenella mellea]